MDTAYIPDWKSWLHVISGEGDEWIMKFKICGKIYIPHTFPLTPGNCEDNVVDFDCRSN